MMYPVHHMMYPVHHIMYPIHHMMATPIHHMMDPKDGWTKNIIGGSGDSLPFYL